MAMNNYSNYKVYVFGSWIRNGHDDIEPFTGSWKELLQSEDFIEFGRKHELTDDQLDIIERGFHGWDIESEPPEEKTKEDDYEFPFGTHKGKPLSSVPDNYYLFLLTQPWIIKWPVVNMYARSIKNKVNKNGASSDDIKNILHKIL